MKRGVYVWFMVVLAVIFTANNAFSMSEEGKDKTAFFDIVQDDIIKIYKKTEKGIDTYTYQPKGTLDEYTITAIESRLKNMYDEMVSFSVDEKNVVKLVMKPIASEDEFNRIIAIVTKPYEYYQGNFEIIETE